MIPHPIAGIYFGRGYIPFPTLEEAKGFLEYLIARFGPYDQAPDELYFEAFKVTTRRIGPNIQMILAHLSSTPPSLSLLYQAGLINHETFVNHKNNDVPAPLTSRQGVTLQDSPLTPSAARAALRKAGLSRPKGGWKWQQGHPDLEKVKKVLRIENSSIS